LKKLFSGKASLDPTILKAYRRYGYRLAEIAEHLQVHYSTVSRRLKRALPLLIGFLIFTAGPVHADDPLGLLIQGVIQQQLKAFNADDYPSAYQYASKHIQSKFTLDEFEAMVRTGYPQIAKSIRTVFGGISYSTDRLHATVQVDVTGADRVTVRAQYRMVLEKGNWKIDGVMLLDRSTPI
jgi:hypothetical protein